MKLVNIISEINFYTYLGMIKVAFSDSTTTTEVSELLRALPGVTTVAPTGTTDIKNVEVYKIRLISQKKGSEAFKSLKDSAVRRYPMIKRVDIAFKTIEKK